MQPALLIISHVCRTWRTLACATSTLWSHIRVTLWSSPALSNLFLARSRACTFTLTVVPGTPRTSTSPGGVLGVLVNHMERCRSITLVTTGDEVLMRVLSALVRMNLPVLSELNLQHYDHQWSAQRSPALLSSISTPRLAILRVKSVSWDWRTTILDELTTLELDIPFDHPRMALSLVDFRAVVAAAPRLRHLGLIGAPLIIDVHSPSPVHVPYLHTLELDVVLSLSLSHKVCSLLETPNLESLTLSHDLAGMTAALWKRSADQPCRYPKLRELQLSFVSSSDLRFLDDAFVHAMPAVKELRLLNVDIQVGMQLLSQIRSSVSTGGQMHWPRLQTLTLERWPMFDLVSPHMLVTRTFAFTDAEVVAIASMLALRRGMGAPVKLLRMQSASFGQPTRVIHDLERFTSVEWAAWPSHFSERSVYVIRCCSI